MPQTTRLLSLILVATVPGCIESGDNFEIALRVPGDNAPGDSATGDSATGDNSPGDNSMGDGTAGDASPGDTSPGDGTAGDVSPCAGVSCSGNGSCSVAGSTPTCNCNLGFIAVDLQCLGITNIALNKPAFQSSTYAQTADVAVDGDISGENNHNQTNAEPQAWWEVDLTALAMIERIDIYNRTSTPSYADRLAAFHVFVSDVPFTSTVISETQTQNGVFDYFVAGEAGYPTTIPVIRTGRYVRVQLTGSEHLHMSEVEVYGAIMP